MEDLPISKQRQKISFLQKKLQLAEKQEKKCKEQIEQLSDEIRQVELSYIRKQVDHFEELVRKHPNKKSDYVNLFADERERLHTMLQQGQSPYEAQVALERILQLIVELSNQEETF